MQRSLGFAALAFLTLVPLLIVVAAADPTQAAGFARWVGNALGASAASQEEIQHLFSRPRRALQSTAALGLAALAVFGLTFASTVQTAYEKTWSLPPARWHAVWRHAVWLAFLIGYLSVFTSTPLRRDAVIGTPGGTLLALMATLVFFWWSPWLLLGSRAGLWALLPGAVLTTAGMVGLRTFSKLVFSPRIVSSTVTYGPVGTVLVIQSWLVGVGFVLFGGTLLGRIVDEKLRSRR
ncbi:ribonuclease BN [Streptomyces sp. NPDC001922]|uniref:ribonuclease BN n=1 Tax=Streptomyces sp. NPDC001922 TaxID=3364624 RepID=UPI0036B8BFD0